MSKITSREIDLTTILQAVYPVGSIYVNASVDTNPATLLGFGTWIAFGEGRVMVGQDTGDTDFDTLGETRGAKTHTLTTGEIPAHTHAKSTMARHNICNQHSFNCWSSSWSEFSYWKFSSR